LFSIVCGLPEERFAVLCHSCATSNFRGYDI
jgi:hypothetical protein